MAQTSIWKKLEKPIVALAPMEGFTDSPFRRIVKSVSPDIICYTEFTSADGIKYDSDRSKRKLFFQEEERPLIFQLFGSKIENFLEAAKWVEELGGDGLDINMGCPARNVVATQCGAAMIQNPDHAAELVHLLTKQSSLPISVKTRIGYKTADMEHFLNFTDKLVEAGAQALVVHGRTSKQGYTGSADWSYVYELKKRNPEIKVLGNGDVTDGAVAREKVNNLDGVMVGRATLGHPWLLKEIHHALTKLDEPVTPTEPELFLEKLPLIRKHAEYIVEFKGEKRGMLEIRKHLAAYIKGVRNASSYRDQLVRVESLAGVMEICDEIEKGLVEEE